MVVNNCNQFKLAKLIIAMFEVYGYKEILQCLK